MSEIYFTQTEADELEALRRVVYGSKSNLTSQEVHRNTAREFELIDKKLKWNSVNLVYDTPFDTGGADDFLQMDNVGIYDGN